jgi:hypothetical protein
MKIILEVETFDETVYRPQLQPPKLISAKDENGNPVEILAVFRKLGYMAIDKDGWAHEGYKSGSTLFDNRPGIRQSVRKKSQKTIITLGLINIGEEER